MLKTLKLIALFVLVILLALTKGCVHMCLIALTPQGAAPMDKEEMRMAWQTNHDGAGYMYAKDGKLKIRKPFFKFKELYASFKADFDKHGGSSPFIMHFRLATHGGINKEGTHPFRVPSLELGMAHNGILWTDHANQHDSKFFIDTVLAYRTTDEIMDPAFNIVMEEMIGSFNKLAFLNGKGEYSIVNEEAGEWMGGTWFSNTTWMGAYARYCGYDPDMDELWEEEWSQTQQMNNPGKVRYYKGRAFYWSYDKVTSEWERIYLGEDGNVTNKGRWWEKGDEKHTTTKPKQITHTTTTPLNPDEPTAREVNNVVRLMPPGPVEVEIEKEIEEETVWGKLEEAIKNRN